MTAIEMGADAIDRQDPPQAKRCGRLLRLVGSAALAGALAGCSGLPGFMHRMEGGQIAKPLKPPPGIHKPFPNLASVPARPAAPDQAALERLSQSLIADRENARHLTVAATPDPSLPAASPGLFGVGSLPPPQPAGSGAAATLAAAQGPPPAAAAPPAAAPAASPLPAGPSASSAPAPQAGTARGPVASTPLPSVPAGPPARARIATAGPASAPAASVGTPIPPEPSPPANPATTVNVSFPPASAVLPAEAADALHALATRRGGHAVAVVGHGDATSPDPDAQSQAVALGLQRAQAIAQSLAAAGVPDSAVRLNAEAGGRGGSARILQ